MVHGLPTTPIKRHLLTPHSLRQKLKSNYFLEGIHINFTRIKVTNMGREDFFLTFVQWLLILQRQMTANIGDARKIKNIHC